MPSVDRMRAVLTDLFASRFVLPVGQRFVHVADMSGVVPMPSDLKPGTHDDILLVAPSMPWIDPLKEITAWVMAVQAGFASEYEVLRKRLDLVRDLFAARARAPRGIWLAECAFNPGDDEYLREAGIRFFITDAHAILYGTPRPRRGAGRRPLAW